MKIVILLCSPVTLIYLVFQITMSAVEIENINHFIICKRNLYLKAFHDVQRNMNVYIILLSIVLKF